MIPAVVSSMSAAAGRGADGDPTLAELSRQMQSLQQKLSVAQKDTTPPRGAQAASITGEIVNVQAQMERMILEAQLAKLRASINAAAGADAAGSAAGSGGDAGGSSPGTPGASAAASASGSSTGNGSSGSPPHPGAAHAARGAVARYQSAPQQLAQIDERA